MTTEELELLQTGLMANYLKADSIVPCTIRPYQCLEEIMDGMLDHKMRVYKRDGSNDDSFLVSLTPDGRPIVCNGDCREYPDFRAFFERFVWADGAVCGMVEEYKEEKINEL